MLTNQLKQLPCQDKAILKYLLILLDKEDKIIAILNNPQSIKTIESIKTNLEKEIVSTGELYLMKSYKDKEGKTKYSYQALSPSDSLIHLLVEYSLKDIFERLYENLNSEPTNTIRAFAENPYRKTYQYEKELRITYETFRQRLSTIYKALLINHLICYGNPNNWTLKPEQDNKRKFKKQLLILLLKYKLDLFTRENLKIILQKTEGISRSLKKDILQKISVENINKDDIAKPSTHSKPARKLSYFYPSYFYLERPHTIGEKYIEQECMENIDKGSLTKILNSFHYCFVNTKLKFT